MTHSKNSRWWYVAVVPAVAFGLATASQNVWTFAQAQKHENEGSHRVVMEGKIGEVVTLPPGDRKFEVTAAKRIKNDPRVRSYFPQEVDVLEIDLVVYPPFLPDTQCLNYAYDTDGNVLKWSASDSAPVYLQRDAESTPPIGCMISQSSLDSDPGKESWVMKNYFLMPPESKVSHYEIVDLDSNHEPALSGDAHIEALEQDLAEIAAGTHVSKTYIYRFPLDDESL